MHIYLSLLAAVLAKRQAVYSYNYTTAYILNGDTLYSLHLSGSQESTSSLSQELKQISTPGTTDISLIMDNKNKLYALSGDGCQTAINVQVYDSSADKWSSLQNSPDSWYRPNSTAWFDSASNSILVYGGVFCNNSIAQSFYNYSIADNQWNTAHASPMPREMAYGQVIRTSNESTIILGGRTNSGWLSMQQIAIWQYGSWSYSSVGNYSNIDSRDDPFLLPLWDNPQSSVDGVVVVGGSVAGRNATPHVLLLDFNATNGWNWASTTIPESDLMVSVYDGVYSNTNNAIYGSAGQSVKSISPVAQKSTDSDSPSKKLDAGGIAALSTIIPLFIITSFCIGLWYWWRKRKQRQTFLPRQSQIIETQSLDMDNFPDFKYPPVRKQEQTRLIHHPQQNSHSEYDQNEVHFITNRLPSHLRVVNPDFETSSLSSIGTLNSGTSLLDNDNRSISSSETVSHGTKYYRSHRSAISQDITEMTHSRSTSIDEASVKSRVSSDFDFTQ